MNSMRIIATACLPTGLGSVNRRVRVRVLDPRVKSLPEKATDGSAGYDLRAVLSSPVRIMPGDSYIVPTGFAFEIDEDLGGFIFPRSKLGNDGLVLGNLVGVIDSDCRGEIKISAWNRTADQVMQINPGDRIAQIVFMPAISVDFDIADKLTNTVRGTGIFGSTGIK